MTVDTLQSALASPKIGQARRRQFQVSYRSRYLKQELKNRHGFRTSSSTFRNTLYPSDSTMGTSGYRRLKTYILCFAECPDTGEGLAFPASWQFKEKTRQLKPDTRKLWAWYGRGHPRLKDRIHSQDCFHGPHPPIGLERLATDLHRFFE